MKASRILPRLAINCFGAVALWSISMLLVPVAGAQNSSVLPRINQPVSESSLTTLRGNVSSLVRPEYDRGEAVPSTQLTHVRLVLSRSPEQEAALEELMQKQLEKSSPNYHKWLTPDQLGKLYGPADSDISAIVAWLESHGLHVDPVSPARTNISFSGSVSQLEEALHTAIHSFERDGQQFYANASEPRIPLALASVVRGLAHLNTYKPRPHNVPGSPGMLDQQSNRLVPMSGMSPRPELTTGTAPNNFLYIVPGDAATIYDTPNSFNANFSSGTSYTGSGVTIGIGGDGAIQPSTVVNYRTRFLGDSTAPTITNVNGVTANGSTDEAYLDNEIAGGLAPGATIHFYTATDLGTGIDQMLTDNSVDIFSLSFGLCEAMLPTSDNALISSWWQQAATQGISVTVSTGDSGSATCDNDNTEVAAADGLAVSGWATTPYNIAVGGTDLYGLLSGFTQYASTTNGANYRSALKYIPEATWNDSTSVNTAISADVPTMNSGKTNIVAGGGGASSCSTNTVNAQNQVTCVSGNPKPTWQYGPGVPNDSVRDIPDVSLMAGNGFDVAAWLVCTDDTGTVNNTTVTANCSTQSNGKFYFYGFGGTSTSAPAFAGILALVQQKVGSRLGMDAAKTLYDLSNGGNASSIFHDITVGNNSVYCTAASPNCSTDTAGYPFLTGYNTGTGYDLATGLGSVDASQLINYWSAATGSGTATVAVSPASTTITLAQPLSVPVTVSGTLGTPTGTVTLTSTGYTSQPGTLANGAFTFTIPADSLPAGTDILTVTYSGDPNYSTESGSSTVIVNLLTATVSATASPSNITSSQGTTVTVTVAGTSGTPTGTVTLTSGSYSSGAKSLSSGSATFSISAGALAVGTDTVTASYSGDTTYNAGTGTASVTVTQAALLTPTVTVSPASTTITVAQPLSVPVTVTGSGTLGTPTGTVTLTTMGYTSQPGTLANGAFTFTIPAGSLPGGTDKLTVTYSGDSNYSTESGSSTVIVNLLAATVSPTASPNNITSAQGTTVTVAVAGTSGTPTGTVTLTSGSYSSGAKSLSSGSVSFSISAGVLPVGTDTVTASYSGDTSYNTATGTANVTVMQAVLLTPTVTVTPAVTSINSNQSLSVAATVSGTGATPSGTVTLSGGGYTSSAQTLVSGTSTFTIPANSLSVGSDTITVNYSGDANYSSGTGSANVTVNSVPQSSPEGAYFGTASNGETFETIILPNDTLYALYGTTASNIFTVSGLITGNGTASSGTYTAPITDYSSTGSVYTGNASATYVAGTSINGTVTDSGVGSLSFSGTAVPTSQYNFNTAAAVSEISGSWTGTLFGGNTASVTVSSNGSFTGSSLGCSYTGTATPDSSGKNFFDFSLTFGASGCLLPNQTLTGIAVEYLLSDGVTHQLLAAVASGANADVFIANSSSSSGSGTFKLSASAPTAINPGQSASSTITLSGSNGYLGAVTVTCALTSSPAGASDLPACNVSGSPVNLTSTTTSGSVTATASTTAATAAVKKLRIGGWAEAGSGAVLALLVFFGIPARRRGWRVMLGAIALMLALGSFGACGGGSSGGGGGGGGGGGNPGTTAGNYTFTVTGTGNDPAKTTQTATFTVTVN